MAKMTGCSLHHYTDDNGRAFYVFECTFNARFIPQKAGFTYQTVSRRWATYKKDVAAKLAEYADDDLRAELVGYSEGKAQAINESAAIDADIEIPTPKGLQFYPFQKAGINYGRKRDNVLIADDMGLGKTAQSIGLLNIWKPQLVLIICTATVKLNWVNELNRWLTDVRSIVMLGSGNTTMREGNIYVVNYDMLRKIKWLSRIKWDVLIADEVHFVKNKNSFRGKAFYDIAERAKKRVYLSGTPMLNRPIELYHIIKSLGIEMERMVFAHRFCAAKNSYDLKGASNLEELQRLLRSRIMVRRLKGDVLKDLPDKVRQLVTLDANEIGATKMITAEQAAEARWEKTKQQLEEAKELAQEGNNWQKSIKELAAIKRAEFNEMAQLRHKTALTKVPYGIKHIEGLLEGGVDKIIVFAYHRDVLSLLGKGLEKKYKIVGIVGGDKDTQRQQAVDKFQNGDARIFLASIGAAAEGITLTAASVVLFVELDWIPAKIRQAEDRAHRIGQKDTVLVQYLVVDNSIDSKIALTMTEKQAVADEALNR